MSERYYVSCPVAPGVLILEGAEAHHLVSVSRLRPGQLVYLFNGDGREYQARITAVQRRSVELDVLGSTAPNRELPVRLTVAAPLPKGDRTQFLIEKLTELGVTAYVPLRTRRSVIHPPLGRSEKLLRYVIEASKQCGRNVLMQVEELCSWEDFLRRDNLGTSKLLAHPTGEPLPQTPGVQDTALAFGPEGGFLEEELEPARRAGWLVVSLGPRVLRVETAALALAAIIGARLA
jgi:16S rRNA (uracil1498-N3)-methyltransferase